MIQCCARREVWVLSRMKRREAGLNWNRIQWQFLLYVQVTWKTRAVLSTCVTINFQRRICHGIIYLCTRVRLAEKQWSPWAELKSGNVSFNNLAFLKINWDVGYKSAVLHIVLYEWDILLSPLLKTRNKNTDIPRFTNILFGRVCCRVFIL